MILSIDPGNIHTAYCLIDENNGLKPITFGKIPNEDLLRLIANDGFRGVDFAAIEMVACYGMAVGKEVFETCVGIGRFYQALVDTTLCTDDIYFIYRKDEKMNLCGSMKAKDANIRQALIDRFGVVGTKKNPGWFYGFAADVWAAYAVGVTFYDTKLKGANRHAQA